MRRALVLARRGLGKSSPNPAVGAVVVREGRVVGEGFHAQAGTPHAEIHALAAAGAAARGATVYVTLEPCNHQGRTPPCTRALLAAGVARVVFGARDPNPRATGGGEFLAGRGVAVLGEVLGEACREEHRFFLTHVTTGRPHVILKSAASLTARPPPAPASPVDHRREGRARGHRLRGWVDAIGVGIGTALADDPRLTCRAPGGRDPLRVVLDTHLRLPPTAQVLDPASPASCLVACGPAPDPARREALERAGARVLPLPLHEGRVDLAALVGELGRRGITSLLLEGGAGLAFGFAARGLVDEVMYFLAPLLLGGAAAPGVLGGPGFPRLAEALRLAPPRVSAWATTSSCRPGCSAPLAAPVSLGRPVRRPPAAAPRRGPGRVGGTDNPANKMLAILTILVYINSGTTAAPSTTVKQGGIAMGNPICWAELTTWNPEGAREFYAKLFDWQIKPMPDAALPYLTFDPGQGPGGGIMGLPEPGIPTAWSIYVKVDDLKATCRRLEELGGKVHKPPTEVPGCGRFAVACDPQGAYFCLWQDPA